MISITIRPACAADRPALEEIAARTWDGSDYLPKLIDAWLADTQGGFWVAEENHKAIGTVKLTRIATHEWWMEGMRVHPDFYGRGVGRMLHDHLVTQAQLVGTGALRFCTNMDNRPIQKMAIATGFTLRSRFLRYTLRVHEHQPNHSAFRPLTPEDIPAVRDFLEASRTYEQADRSLIAPRWLCRVITDEYLAELIRTNSAFGWYGAHGNPARIDGVILGYIAHPATESDVSTFHVTYLDALPSYLATLAHEMKAWGASIAVGEMRHMMLVRPDRLVAIEQAGWRRPTDGSGRACLFSRPIGEDA